MNSDEAELLAQISGTIHRVETRQEVHAEGFTKRLDKIDSILQGEGGETGLKGDVAQLKQLVGTDLPVRVNRLEQKEAGLRSRRPAALPLQDLALQQAVGRSNATLPCESDGRVPGDQCSGNLSGSAPVPQVNRSPASSPMIDARGAGR